MIEELKCSPEIETVEKLIFFILSLDQINIFQGDKFIHRYNSLFEGNGNRSPIEHSEKVV